MDEPGYREWSVDSDLVRCAWQVVCDADGEWTDGATEYWGLAWGHDAQDRWSAHLAGPTTRPRLMTLRAGDVSWGVDLQPHVFWRGLAKVDDVGALREVPMDRVAGRWFYEVGGVRLPVPGPADLAGAVESLRTAGLLVAEPLVAVALGGGPVDAPERTLRRRVRSATGLRQGQIRRIGRAREAYALLQSGHALAETAALAGYSDQSHLTRELRALAGHTPAGILDADLSMGSQG